MHPQGNRQTSSELWLRRHDLLNFIDTLYKGDLHAKRVLSLANATLGVLTSASLAIHAVGRGLAQAMGTLTKHGVKQVDRLLSNRGIDVWTFFDYWTPYLIGARSEVVVALDWTSFAADEQETIVLSMLTGHGRATPLLWKTVASSTLKDNQRRYEYEVLCRLREVLPDGVKVTIVADRGFADCKLFYALTTELGFEYVIRLRGDVYVTNARGERRVAAEWVGAGGRARRLVGARVTDGILRCADPEEMQRLADGLTADKIDALLRKWLARLPNPFSSSDRAQGICYDISMLQAEFARTEVFDRPLAGRVFFEEVMRENLDMGRPDHVQLIFDRRVSRRTPTRHRTRVITDGVTPSLHVDYKRSRIKQYHKEGRALRTETVINDTYDFDVGRRLKNLDDLKQIGFAANRRLLGVQTLSHDCTIGAEAFDGLHRPAHIDGQRASALRFGDPRVQALLAALLRFDLLPAGFRNRELRDARPLRAGVAPRPSPVPRRLARSVRRCVAIAQPTIRRLNTSSTMAK